MTTGTHLLCSEVRRRVDEERFVSDVLLDLLPRFLALPESLLRQGNLPVRDVNVRLGGTPKHNNYIITPTSILAAAVGAMTVRPVAKQSSESEVHI